MDDQHRPPEGQDDELVLSIWEGDENAKAQLIYRYVPALERAIGGRFRRLHSGEVEDVVAEAIRRFWERRLEFDPKEVKLSVRLYRICKQVAMEYVSGRLNWQKARLLETGMDNSTLEIAGSSDKIEDDLDRLESERSPLIKTLAAEFAKLSPLEQDVWTAFAEAGDYELNAAQMGIELGKKYQGGVPYTSVNIRQIKFRAKQKLTAAMKTRGFDLKKLGYSND